MRTAGRHSYWSGNENAILDIYDGTEAHKPRDFERWHLTNDFNLSALYRNELEPWLRQHKSCPQRDGPRPSTTSPVLKCPSGFPISEEVSSWVDVTVPFLKNPATTTGTDPQLHRATIEGRNNGPSSSVREGAVNNRANSARLCSPVRKGSKASGAEEKAQTWSSSILESRATHLSRCW